MLVNDSIASIESEGGLCSPAVKPLFGPDGRPCTPRAPRRMVVVVAEAVAAFVDNLSLVLLLASLVIASSNSG